MWSVVRMQLGWLNWNTSQLEISYNWYHTRYIVTNLPFPDINANESWNIFAIFYFCDIRFQIEKNTIISILYSTINDLVHCQYQLASMCCPFKYVCIKIKIYHAISCWCNYFGLCAIDTGSNPIMFLILSYFFRFNLGNLSWLI